MAGREDPGFREAVCFVDAALVVRFVLVPKSEKLLSNASCADGSA